MRAASHQRDGGLQARARPPCATDPFNMTTLKQYQYDLPKHPCYRSLLCRPLTFLRALDHFVLHMNFHDRQGYLCLLGAPCSELAGQ